MFEAGTLKRWRLDPTVTEDDPAASLASSLQLHPLVAQLLARRGLADGDDARRFLFPKLTDLHDPALLPGAARAAERIVCAVRERQPIVIYGDYDVDGITASAILWHTLTLAGADVHCYVPHRVEEGYGLNCEAIQRIAECGVRSAEWEEKKPGPESSFRTPHSALRTSSKPLIISVDCGITAIEPAKVAKDAGVDLIITDHHEYNPDALPDAYALVHPRLTDPSATSRSALRTPHYPFPDLCGAGVAFKLAWLIAKTFCGSERVTGVFRDRLMDLLALAALGTVADIVPLKGENRVITAYGLSRVKHTGIAGLNALIDASALREETIDAYHVGFVLGPRLNACGRMGHAKEAVRLLTTAAGPDAMELAKFLTQQNDRRRSTERAIFTEARQQVVERGYDRDDCRAIVLGSEKWHQGVVGIVASRLVETFCRPVVLLNFNEGRAHGSARSIDGLSIHEAIGSCAAHLTSFGGHAMAAGLRLDVDQVENFRGSLVAFCNERLTPADLVGVLRVDAECLLEDVTLDVIDQVQRLAPFGRDNPAPLLLARDVTVNRTPMRIGSAGTHLSVELRQGSRLLRAVAFGLGDHIEHLPGGAKIDVVFEPKVNLWQGVRKAEMHIKDYRVLSESPERSPRIQSVGVTA